MEDETNRNILARHIGTDFLCCAIVSVMGFMSVSTVCPDLLAAAKGTKGGKQEIMLVISQSPAVFCIQLPVLRGCVFSFFAHSHAQGWL